MSAKKVFNRTKDMGGRKRKLEDVRTISMIFEREMLEKLDEKAFRRGTTRSEFIRELVSAALKTKP